MTKEVIIEAYSAMQWKSVARNPRPRSVVQGPSLAGCVVSRAGLGNRRQRRVRSPSVVTLPGITYQDGGRMSTTMQGAWE